MGSKYASTTAVPQGHTFGDPFRFKKVGKDIAEKANAQVVKLQQEMETALGNTNKLCEKYGVSLDEAIAEEEKTDDNDDVIAATHFSNNMRRTKDVQKDIDDIRKAAREILGFRQQINTFKMLSANIEMTREFDLHFSQLVQLGF